jgi:hypothetical protein
MYKHYLRKMGVREGAEDTAAALLDDPNPALDVTNMFRSSRSVDDDVGGMISNLIKLIVHEDSPNRKSCTSVDCYNPL